MKYLSEITDKEVFTEPEFSNSEEYSFRTTIKIIIKNNEGKIALITNEVHNLYSLPGGGAESENIYEEANRESIEEAQCSIQNIVELVRVKETRNRDAKKYETICFVADTKDFFNEDRRTEGEKKVNLRVEWFSPQEINDKFSRQLEILKNGEISFYNTAFNIYRDNMFWSEFLSRNLHMNSLTD